MPKPKRSRGGRKLQGGCLLLLGLVAGCGRDAPTALEDEGTVTIGTDGGTVNLPDVATVSFPRGFFPDTRSVEVTRPQESSASARFEEFETLFQVEGRADHQIRVLAGSTAPTGNSFRAIVTIPSDLVITADVVPAIFARVYEAGGQEVLDNFQLFDSTWKRSAGTLDVTFPPWVFTNSRRNDGQFEAILMIGLIPAVSASLSSRLGGFSSDASTTCLAAPIGWPLSPGDVRRVTSSYDPQRKIDGRWMPHFGIDFAAPTGTPVLAVSDGVVEDVRIDSNDLNLRTGYGRYLILRHSDGSASLYGHLLSESVVRHDAVTRGSQIATSDNTGATFGAHLHFEYVPSGRITQNPGRIDPFPCLVDDSYAVSVSASPSHGGSVAGGGTFTVGSQVTVTAAVASGFSFERWIEHGIEVSTSIAYSFMVTKDRALTAIFAENPPAVFTINVSASPFNGGIVTGSGTYLAGTQVTATAVPASGFTFDGWTESGSSVSSNRTLTFEATSDRNLVALFIPISTSSHTVTLSASPVHGGEVSGSGTYEANSQISVMATSASGFTFFQWTENGTHVSFESAYQFVITSNRTLVAEFSASELTPTTLITPTDAATEVSVTPHFSWTEVVGADRYWLLVATSPDHLPSNPGAESCSNCIVSGSTSYTHHTLPNDFPETPGGGFHPTLAENTTYYWKVLAWSTSGAPGEFSEVSSFRTAGAAATHTIAVSSSPAEGGTVSGNGSYLANSQVSVTAIPASGFAFVRWTENGSEVSTNATYTFTATEDRFLVAVFSLASAIVVSPTSLRFEAFADGPLPLHVAARVTSVGPGEITGLRSRLTYTSTGAGWGGFPHGLSANIVNSDRTPTNLFAGVLGERVASTPGTYTALVTVSSDRSEDGSVDIPVTYVVRPGPPPTSQPATLYEQLTDSSGAIIVEGPSEAAPYGEVLIGTFTTDDRFNVIDSSTSITLSIRRSMVGSGFVCGYTVVLASGNNFVTQFTNTERVEIPSDGAFHRIVEDLWDLPRLIPPNTVFSVWVIGGGGSSGHCNAEIKASAGGSFLGQIMIR